jgi:hypothetical protein
LSGVLLALGRGGWLRGGLLAGIAAVVSLVLTGCGAVGVGGLKDRSAEADGPAALLREVTSGEFPGFEVVDEARWSVEDGCMSEKGFGHFDGVTTTVSEKFENADRAFLHSWFGVSEAKWGAKYGYREVPTEELFTTVTTEGDQPPEGYFDALYGTDEEWQATGSPGGCAAYAESVINEGTLSRERIHAIGREVERQLNTRARADSAVSNASREWSECMAADGYDYPTPHEAFLEFAPWDEETETHQYLTPSAGDDEKRIAEADGACKEAVGFWDAFYEAKDGAEEAVGVAMRSDLIAVRDSHAQQVENANAILASPR